MILISLLISLHSCDDDNNSIVADGSKPNAEIVVTPQTNIKYGDKLYITGSLTDTRNLEKYIVSLKDKDRKTRPISDGFRKNNVNYWAFREIRSIIPHL